MFAAAAALSAVIAALSVVVVVAAAAALFAAAFLPPLSHTRCCQLVFHVVVHDLRCCHFGQQSPDFVVVAVVLVAPASSFPVPQLRAPPNTAFCVSLSLLIPVAAVPYGVAALLSAVVLLPAACHMSAVAPAAVCLPTVLGAAAFSLALLLTAPANIACCKISMLL